MAAEFMHYLIGKDNGGKEHRLALFKDKGTVTIEAPNGHRHTIEHLNRSIESEVLVVYGLTNLRIDPGT